jgi:hypothetical protein
MKPSNVVLHQCGRRGDLLGKFRPHGYPHAAYRALCAAAVSGADRDGLEHRGQEPGPDGTSLLQFSFFPGGPPGSFGATPRAVAAFDGSHYLVVFTDTFPAGQTEELLAVLLPTSDVASNAPVVIGPLAIASETAGVKSMALGFDGSKYLNATRVSTTGGPLDVVPPGLIFASNGSPSGAIVGSPTLAFDDTNFLLAYTDARAQGAGGLNYAVISASRVSSSGALLDGSPDSPRA